MMNQKNVIRQLQLLFGWPPRSPHSSPHIIELVISAYSYFRFPVLCTNIIVVGDLFMTLFNDVFVIVFTSQMPTFVHRVLYQIKVSSCYMLILSICLSYRPYSL